jgi:hypothetical protein
LFSLSEFNRAPKFSSNFPKFPKASLQRTQFFPERVNFTQDSGKEKIVSRKIRIFLLHSLSLSLSLGAQAI